MKKFTTFFLTLLPFFGFSQTYEWAAVTGDTLTENSNALAIDASGNVYTTGVFIGTVDFDPGAGTFNLTAGGTADIFIQKLDALGNFVWAKQIITTGQGHGESIVVDASGNIYVTGGFDGTADFDPGAGTFNYTSGGGIVNAFILKLDAAGDFVWAKYALSTGTSVPRDLAVDASGNVYSTGNFEETTDFDPGSGTAMLTSLAFRDAYIQKHDAAGNLLWVKQVSGTDISEGKSLAVDASGNTYITGKFWGTADFDPGVGVMSLTSAGADDTFILKLDTSGDLVWVKQMGGIDYEYGYSIEVDPAGNIYTTGSFQATVDFDPGVGTVNLTSAGLDDIYMIKLDAAGDFVWAKQIGGTGSELSFSTVVDIVGNVYIAGAFEGTVDMDPGVGTTSLTSVGSFDIFFLKLDDMGDFIWVKHIGGIGIDFPFSMAVDASANLYATGLFEDTVDFDPEAGIANQTSAGSFDIFVLKLNIGPLSPTTSPLIPKTLTAYPNPTNHQIIIEGELSELEAFRLYNLTGQEVNSLVNIVRMDFSQVVLDLSSLPSGMYTFKTKNTVNKIYKW
ncbi:MAG: hypothetical protein DHS20C18_15140 [Saprospiraceae bacterium]|nr:MAG: hypothetical protein DHS20C18_15140 [Saprospiraceae bacterium]